MKNRHITHISSTLPLKCCVMPMEAGHRFHRWKPRDSARARRARSFSLGGGDKVFCTMWTRCRWILAIATSSLTLYFQFMRRIIYCLPEFSFLLAPTDSESDAYEFWIESLCCNLSFGFHTQYLDSIEPFLCAYSKLQAWRHSETFIRSSAD